MQQTWPKAYAFVRKSEGGNDDRPDDHGGRTSRGITQKEYSAWRLEQNLPDNDVWQASEQEIETIYHNEYWNPWCDLLPVGTDYLYFDMAVNAGPHEATLLLQRSLGVVADGRIGPVTRQAAASADTKALVETYTNAKREFYLSLHQPANIKGWLNRCADVHANALAILGEV